MISGLGRILISLLLAGGLVGCGTTGTPAGKFQGESAKVAAAVNALSNASTSRDTTKICTKLLAPAVAQKLAGAGGSCPRVVDRQLATVDNFTVTVEKVSVNGTTAQAQVKSISSGKNRSDTFNLIRLPDGSWRFTFSSLL